MKQHIYFLIDRSNSIEKHRFAGYKRAVLRALESLKPHQTFNISLFDKTTHTLSSTPLPVTEQTKSLAKQFLDAQTYEGTFAAGELYTTLAKLLPETTPSFEMHTVILLTDGTSSLSTKKQQIALKELLNKTHRQLCIYPATCGNGNDLISLRVLASQTGGTLLYSPTHAAFARKLTKLTKSLSAPLAKEITTSFSSEAGSVKLLATSAYSPPLYNHIPFTVYGAINEPTSITCVIQGLHKQQPFVIQKNITFDRPLSKSPQLEKAWLEQLSLNHWNKYLNTGNAEEMAQAKALEKDASAVKLRQVRSL